MHVCVCPGCQCASQLYLFYFRANVADCLASVHHKVSDKTEVGLITSYYLQTGNVALGLAGKYTLSDGAVLKVYMSICVDLGSI